MSAPMLRLGPDVPDLAALGARSFEELVLGGLEGERGAQVVSRRAGEQLLRVPLPGTPDATGRLTGSPRGAGTGFVFVRRFDGGSVSERARVRFTQPRSSSFAAREWNLLCHLRAFGVGTAEPMAVAEEPGALFARRSVVVTRELERMLALTDWLDAHPSERRHAELARALGLAFRRVFEARVVLLELAPRHVFASLVGGDACAAREIVGLRGGVAHDPSPVPGIALGRLPEIAIASARGGRIVKELGPAARVERLAAFARAFERERALPVRHAVRVFREALGRGLPRDRRRALLRAARARLTTSSKR